MATAEHEKSKLERLELEHANAGYLEDVENSNNLTTDQSQLRTGDITRILLAISSIALGTTASYWGFSPPSAILTIINADIGPSDNSSLFSIMWSLCAGIGIILFGRLSDKFGRRYWIIGASIIGLLGGIIASTAQQMNTLIGANVLLGLSGGVHTCYALTVGEICPNKYKLLGIVICVLPSCLPTGFGAYLALALVHNANWRWCYYSYIIMIVGALVLEFFFYHPATFRQLHGGKRTVMDEIKRVDFVTTIAFGIWGRIIFFGSIFHIVKHIRIQVIVYTVICTVFIGALSTGHRNNKAQSAAFSFLATFPAGILEIIPVTLVQLDANDADLGTVFSIIFLMRTAVGSIFVTIFVAILEAKIPLEIANKVPAAALAAGLPTSSLTALGGALSNGTAAAYAAIPGITPSIQLAISNSLSDSYAAAYAYVYYAAVAVGVVGLVAAASLKNYDHMLTSHVSRRITYSGDVTVNEKLDHEASHSPQATSLNTNNAIDFDHKSAL
ncbi:trichothecene efflux pump [Cryomyces antarcticus]|uniref:Major facilitator superfamily (MFS) profile domain-containing protein n=1 Tax=Cryomyces antarcticus TaxID=329879 RepID=A0ABR0KV03_9PEZI|nr:hypothetical protein LTR39_000004 [Cryomyces antarcticus]KAK5021402.1 hypothetical protein LTR60_000018 [Cryomyces antarcticus]KAK5132141.1 hypothetical protein LTR16_000021 [Cryomyces antarcticus]